MSAPPRDVTVTIYCGDGIAVASGPLILMAYGLTAIADRSDMPCWIDGPHGRISPSDAREAIARWSRVA
jgi:hypothetical protein